MGGAFRPQATGGAQAGGRASDAIVRRLQQQILEGELPHDSPLPSERDLMERFTASRTVVREAVAALASRGLVEARPRYRPIVRKPGSDTALSSVGAVIELMLREKGGVEALFQSRAFVERGLARDAATGANREDIAALKDALAANEAAIPDSESFFTTDIAFHGVLYRIPRNPIFPTLHQAYTAWLFPHWKQMVRGVERNRLNYRSHAAILTAILERDPDAAEAAVTAHLDHAWSQVRATFDLD